MQTRDEVLSTKSCTRNQFGILYFVDWTGLDCTGLVKRGLVKRGLVKRGLVKRGLVKRGLTIGSCGRLFLDFFRVCKSDNTER